MDEADRLFYKNARNIGRSQNWYRIPFPPNRHRLPHAGRRSRSSKYGKNIGDSELPSQKWAQPWRDEHDAEWDSIDGEFEQLKRSVDADPYGTVFGRRLHPFTFGHMRGPWSMFLNSFFGSNNSSLGDSKIGQDRQQPTKKSRQQGSRDDAEDNAASHSGSEILFKFDPVSGRMIPKESAAAGLNKDANSKIKEVKNPVEKSSSGVEHDKPSVESESNGSPTQGTPKGTEQIKNMRGAAQKQQEGRSSDEFPGVHEVEGKDARRNIDFFAKEPYENRATSSNKSSRDEDVSSVGENKTSAKKEEEVRRPKFSRLEEARDDQTPNAGSWARSSQALFSNFKDYLSSKLELEDQKESPDTQGWPLFARNTLESSVSKSELRKNPLSQANHCKDPESDELETLRASDIRASFQPRETDQGNKSSATPSNEEVEETIEEPIRLDATETVGGENAAASKDRAKPDQLGSTSQFGSIQSEEAEPPKGNATTEPKQTASVSTDFNDPNLVDLLRAMHEETHGKVASVNQDYATNETGEAAQVSQSEPEKGKSAALVTDSLSMAGPAINSAVSAVESSPTNGKETPANTVPDEPLLTAAQRDKLDRLLTEVELVNAETPAILKELRKAIDEIAVDLEEGTLAPLSEEDPEYVDMPPQAKYRVLSYDSLTREVKDASMTSGSDVAFEPLHPADAIARLYNPSKFLPYFAWLEGQGYELFSGGPEFLIWKNTRPADPTATDLTTGDTKSSGHSPAQAARLEQESTHHGEPGSNESQSTSSSPKTDSSSSSSSSDSSNKDHSHPLLRKVTRRMFLTGVITGGTCYAIGVVAEYFKTGGQDGQGPRGFTGLEGR